MACVWRTCTAFMLCITFCLLLSMSEGTYASYSLHPQWVYFKVLKQKMSFWKSDTWKKVYNTLLPSVIKKVTEQLTHFHQFLNPTENKPLEEWMFSKIREHGRNHKGKMDRFIYKTKIVLTSVAGNTPKKPYPTPKSSQLKSKHQTREMFYRQWVNISIM